MHFQIGSPYPDFNVHSAKPIQIPNNKPLYTVILVVAVALCMCSG